MYQNLEAICSEAIFLRLKNHMFWTNRYGRLLGNQTTIECSLTAKRAAITVSQQARAISCCDIFVLQKWYQCLVHLNNRMKLNNNKQEI